MTNPQNAAERLALFVSRRDFLKTSAAATVLLAGGNYAHAAGSDKIRVGVIGCGGRGSGAAKDCMDAAPYVEIVALGDLFPDRVQGCLNRLRAMGNPSKPKKNAPNEPAPTPTKEAVEQAKRYKEQVNIADDRVFSGFDAYEKVLASGVDLVILATPPGFRPLHLRAAVNANKHVFMEKPVAVDPTGVRSVIESSALAAQKNLAIVAGTQRRHQADYRETIQRIRAGAIGDIVSAQCYWNQGGLWNHARKPGWSDTEWQIRNWLYFAWLSGDHIVEQHVHNLDVINWALGAHPVKALGMGGRQSRTDPAYGHVYDHFTVEYEYPNGVRVSSMCRQIDDTATRVGENLIGTKGTSNAKSSIRGENAWRWDGPVANPYVQEHVHLLESIRANKPLNEGKQVAESTLTAVLGRLSAYSGQEVTWDQALNSSLDLMPTTLAWGPLPVPAVAVPGKTPLAEVIPPPATTSARATRNSEQP